VERGPRQLALDAVQQRAVGVTEGGYALALQLLGDRRQVDVGGGEVVQRLLRVVGRGVDRPSDLAVIGEGLWVGRGIVLMTSGPISCAT